MTPAFVALPQPRPAHYSWGDPPRRENYLVMGVAILDLDPGRPMRNLTAGIHRATLLLTIRADGRMAWFGVDQLILDAPELKP
jgi:hypothetical protein